MILQFLCSLLLELGYCLTFKVVKLLNPQPTIIFLRYHIFLLGDHKIQVRLKTHIGIFICMLYAFCKLVTWY